MTRLSRIRLDRASKRRAATRSPIRQADGGKRAVTLPTVAGLPVDQHLGNLEGKELRFGTSAGATFAAMTVDVTDGAVNCEHDSLNPLARCRRWPACGSTAYSAARAWG